MFPPQQFPGQWQSSPGALRVPPGPLENHPVNRSTSSTSTPPPQSPSGPPGRHPICLLANRVQPPAEPQKTDVAGIVDLPPLQEMFYDEYDEANKNHNSSDLGGAVAKPPISKKQTEFSLKQFAKRLGQANYSAFNNWKTIWVAGFVQKKHRSIIRGQNLLKQVRDGLLHREMVVADIIATFEIRLRLVNFDDAEWIRQQWVEMFLNKYASAIREACKKGRQGNMRPTTDLGECMGKNARRNLRELPNTIFTVMICWVSNGKDFVLAPKHIQASYTDVRHWKELVDFINKNGSPKKPDIVTSMFKCTLEQDELEEEYMGFYTHGQMINDPIYRQISLNCCLSNAFKLKLGHNVKIFFAGMM